MDKKMQLKPCPFCGHKNVKITERRNSRRSGHWKDEGEPITKEWLAKTSDELFEDWVAEVVIKVSANVICNACKAKGGTAVGFIEGCPRPGEIMKKIYNVEPLSDIHGRAIDKWNRRD